MQHEDHPLLLSLNQVARLTSLSRTAINRYRSAGQFPQPVSVGERRLAFVRAEVVGWVNERIAKRAERVA